MRLQNSGLISVEKLCKLAEDALSDESKCLWFAGTEFEKVWRGLKGDVPGQAAYLHLLNPSALPAIFKTSLTGSLLASIVDAALHGSVSPSSSFAACSSKSAVVQICECAGVMSFCNAPI